MEKVKRAYAACLACLLDKLPIQNKVLKCLSAFDPVIQKSRDDRILACLQRLPDLVTNVLEEHEPDFYNQQCRKYVLDQTIPPVKDGERVDVWWSKDFVHPGYECLA